MLERATRPQGIEYLAPETGLVSDNEATGIFRGARGIGPGDRLLGATGVALNNRYANERPAGKVDTTRRLRKEWGDTTARE